MLLHTLSQRYRSQVKSLSTLDGESLLTLFSALNRSLSSLSLSVNLSIIPSYPKHNCHSLPISLSLSRSLAFKTFVFCPSPVSLLFLSLHAHLILCIFFSSTSSEIFYCRLNCHLSELSFFLHVSTFSASKGSLTFQFCDA